MKKKWLLLILLFFRRKQTTEDDGRRDSSTFSSSASSRLPPAYSLTLLVMPLTFLFRFVYVTLATSFEHGDSGKEKLISPTQTRPNKRDCH